MKFAVAFALLAQVAAECPNACSGHGECGTKDMCECYANYQGNDCSERTCYFGLAHVDTPKGDLNSDGVVSGPLTTVITGSETYPWGTQEQYPNADANEGHFYMECSNKGICDRKSGECECFDGYEGTACVRASCPNDCSGHGTCESIRELAELKTYDSNALHVAAVPPSHPTINIEESYDYNLWDADKTMGCKCDPGYHGADCSQKKCKYGVDPLFADDEGIIHQSTVVHLGSKGPNAAAISGTFNIDFFDVFGEKYTTKPLDAARASLGADGVVAAFEALPNDVIQQANTDVTRLPPDAVDVSVQSASGEITTAGSLGAGGTGSSGGAGLGVFGDFGPEFTVSFKTNPGILKTIELDTRQIVNAGTTDYWVANIREGQFDSRYTAKKERVNTLLYGSKYLYTNTDPSNYNVNGDELIKVNGQEFFVKQVFADAKIIELNTIFLGASIRPILTDTGAVATAIDLTSDPKAITLKTGFGVTDANSGAFGAHAMLYMQNRPFTNGDAQTSTGTTLAIASDGDILFHFATDQEDIVYRRSENFDNQNFYQAESDSAAEATEAFCATRGSADIYACEATALGSYEGGDVNKVGFVDNTGTAEIPTAVVQHSGVFIGVEGPYKVESLDTDNTLVELEDTNPGQTRVSDFLPTAGAGNANFNVPAYHSTAITDSVDGIKVALFNGRRYKVASVVLDATGTTENSVKGGKVSLTETFSGPHIEQVCQNCITDLAAAASGSQAITIAAGFPIKIAASDALLVGGSASYDNLVFASADPELEDGEGGDITVNESGSSSAFASMAAAASTELSLYRLTNQNGFKPVWVTESGTQETYNYVSQCSNRGNCDGTTGLCTCFKGYSNDNCNLQNMLAV